MSKLIYVDRLKKDILALQDCYNGFSDTYDKACIIGVIDEQPTVEERKTGHWILHKNGLILKDIWGTCSVCGNILRFENVNAGRGDANYCPNCGARMESEK